ncbi:hypothetical protein ASG99_21685 [Bacillus sp. Soil768D1]|nr:hypothetical protein ASG99_21685 [Bacillus sp. Soil768D1]
MASGCQQESKSVEQTNAKAESKKEVGQVKLVTEEEAKDILKTNIESIDKALKKSGTENGWSNQNPVDFEKVKPKLKPYTTDQFVTTTMKDTVENYYCECDGNPLPQFNPDIHFTVNQDKADQLQITALEPASEIHNMGVAWKFNLSKENDQWKMAEWKKESLEGKDIQLKKEEAEKLLTKSGEAATFYKEVDSKEAGGKAYVFKVKAKDYERIVAISPKDTRFVQDYEIETELVDEDFSKSKETLIKPFDFNEYRTNLHFEYTKDKLVKEFGTPASEKESSSDIVLEYDDSIYTISKVSGVVYQVEIFGAKASYFFKDFKVATEAMNPSDSTYAQYEENSSKDEKGYHLSFSDMYTTFVFTSWDKKGVPIHSILISDSSLK